MTTAKNFVAVQECSAGNETVGSMWLRTATFPADTPLSEVWAWAQKDHNSSGRLMLRPDESTEDADEQPF